MNLSLKHVANACFYPWHLGGLYHFPDQGAFDDSESEEHCYSCWYKTGGTGVAFTEDLSFNHDSTPY